jgi:hypothetical protein
MLSLFYESFSFQRTKKLQFQPAILSGFSVEAADNLPDLLDESTTFL